MKTIVISASDQSLGWPRAWERSTLVPRLGTERFKMEIGFGLANASTHRNLESDYELRSQMNIGMSIQPLFDCSMAAACTFTQFSITSHAAFSHGAWQLLREAGIKQFVITADHGFLLKDGVGEVQAHGRKVDPSRRHILRPPSAEHKGEQHVPLADLGYEGCEEHLMFPETTAAFDIGDKSLNYLHGGKPLIEDWAEKNIR